MPQNSPFTPSRSHTHPPLTPTEGQASREKHGRNILSVKGRRSFFRRFLSNLSDPVIRILLCALTLNLIFSFKGFMALTSCIVYYDRA